MNFKKILSLCLLLLILAVQAQTAVVIKMGSLAPAGSPFDIHLKKMAAEWDSISKGEVQVKIYSGGILGDEEDMIRKMRVDQLQAAALTGVGLSRIYSPILTIHAPLVFKNYDEASYVLNALGDEFNVEMKKNGFNVLVWTVASWVYYFSKEPVIYPDDLRKQKLWVWQGDSHEVQAYKKHGFQPVPLGWNDILPGLQSGMIDAFSTTPMVCAAYQLFGAAQNMCEMKWAPLTGGVLISQRAWNRIPADLRPRLAEAAADMSKGLQTDIIQADLDAIELMKQYGLKVNAVPPDAQKKWKEFFDSAFLDLLGANFDKNIYEKILALLKEYRK